MEKSVWSRPGSGQLATESSGPGDPARALKRSDSLAAEANVKSTEGLYRRFDDELTVFLLNLNVVASPGHLTKLDGYVVAGQGPHEPVDFVYSTDVKGARRSKLLIHVAAHAILGHMLEPFRTFVEPRRGAGYPKVKVPIRDLREGNDADRLVHAIWEDDVRAMRAMIERCMHHRPYGARMQALTHSLGLSGLVTDSRYKTLGNVLRSLHAQDLIYRLLELFQHEVHKHDRSGLVQKIRHWGPLHPLRRIYFEIDLDAELRRSAALAELPDSVVGTTAAPARTTTRGGP